MRTRRVCLLLLGIALLAGGESRAVELASPVEGARVAPGAPVLVRVELAPGEDVRQLRAVWDSGETTEAIAGALELETPVPLSAVGPTLLAVFATLADGEVDILPVTLNVDPGPLLRLVVSAPPVLAQVGQVVPLEVQGIFADGVARDLTHPEQDTTYATSDDDVLGVHESGLIQARTRGEAQLLVTSRGRTQTVRIRVDVPDPPENAIPVADPGADRVVAPMTLVELSGAASRDPDGDALVFRWEQVSGPPVILYAADTAEPYFIAPNVEVEEALGFSLVVRDPQGATSFPAPLRVTVRP